jgi:hypothetical protein
VTKIGAPSSFPAFCEIKAMLVIAGLVLAI